MNVMFATLYQFYFCQLLRFIIIQLRMEFFHFPPVCMHRALELKHFGSESLKKVLILEP